MYIFAVTLTFGGGPYFTRHIGGFHTCLFVHGGNFRSGEGWGVPFPSSSPLMPRVLCVKSHKYSLNADATVPRARSHNEPELWIIFSSVLSLRFFFYPSSSGVGRRRATILPATEWVVFSSFTSLIALSKTIQALLPVFNPLIQSIRLKVKASFFCRSECANTPQIIGLKWCCCF